MRRNKTQIPDLRMGLWKLKLVQGMLQCSMKYSCRISLPPTDCQNFHSVLLCVHSLLWSGEDVLKMLLGNAVGTSKASGPDGVSSGMLKATAHPIAPSLTKLFNISITIGKIPGKWKLSAVVPIPKTPGGSTLQKKELLL